MVCQECYAGRVGAHVKLPLQLQINNIKLISSDKVSPSRAISISSSLHLVGTADPVLRENYCDNNN